MTVSADDVLDALPLALARLAAQAEARADGTMSHEDWLHVQHLLDLAERPAALARALSTGPVREGRLSGAWADVWLLEGKVPSAHKPGEVWLGPGGKRCVTMRQDNRVVPAKCPAKPQGEGGESEAGKAPTPATGESGAATEQGGQAPEAKQPPAPKAAGKKPVKAKPAPEPVMSPDDMHTAVQQFRDKAASMSSDEHHAFLTGLATKMVAMKLADIRALNDKLQTSVKDKSKEGLVAKIKEKVLAGLVPAGAPAEAEKAPEPAEQPEVKAPEPAPEPVAQPEAEAPAAEQEPAPVEPGPTAKAEAPQAKGPSKAAQAKVAAAAKAETVAKARASVAESVTKLHAGKALSEDELKSLKADSEHLSGADLQGHAQKLGLKKTGTKDAHAARLLAHAHDKSEAAAEGEKAPVPAPEAPNDLASKVASAVASATPSNPARLADVRKQLGPDVTRGELQDYVRQNIASGALEVVPFTGPAHQLKDNADAFVTGNAAIGYAVVPTGKPLQPPKSEGRKVAGDPHWENDVLGAVAKWRAERPLNSLPIPELYRAVGNGVSIGQFHDGLRDMAKKGVLELRPFTRPGHELPEPELALMADQEVKGYVSSDTPPKPIPAAASTPKPPPDASSGFPPDDAVRGNASFREAEDRVWKQQVDFLTDSISDEEKVAVSFYTDKGFTEINDSLRSGSGMGARARAVTEQLDNVFSKLPAFSRPEVCYRGLNIEAGADKLLAELQKASDSGEAWEMPGFGSTSLDAEQGWGLFAGDHRNPNAVRMEIKARHGLYSEPLSATKGEQEVLLPRSSKFRVVAIKSVPYKEQFGTKTHTVRIVQLEQLP